MERDRDFVDHKTQGANKILDITMPLHAALNLNEPKSLRRQDLIQTAV